MSSSRRVIGTRSKSRDEQDSKENVENDGPTTAPKTPGTAKTSRSAASLFSPPLRGSPSYSMHSEAMKKQPDPFPDNWEEAMGAPSSASRRSRAREPSDSFGYNAGGGMSQQTDSRGDDRKMTSWESRDRGMNNIHRQDCGGNNYGSLAADLDMAAREGVADDFPAVADCFNLGSFAEESPPRHRGHRSSPKGSPHSYEHQGQPYPYRTSPPPYPPSGLPHGSPHYHPPSGPPYPGAGPPPMYYQGPPAGSPYGYPPPHHHQGPPPQGGPYRYSHPPYQGEPWMSPPAPFPDFAPPGRGTPPRGSPPPKKRRSSDWDNGRSNSSSPGEEGSTTPEKVFPEKQEPMRSPFRSPVPTGEKSSAKKYKRSPLFQGGTPGIAAYGSGSWDTPGGTLNAALGEDFSPMGPFAFGDESLETAPEAPMPFDSKLALAATESGEDPAPSHPPTIRQRTGQPAASPFSAFVGDLSPFPPQPPPPMRGSPVNLEQRDYVARHHPGYQAYHRSPQDDYPRHPGMPTPSKRNGLGGPPGRHPMASPVMTGSSQRQQPWYDHVAPSPGPFRLELGDGKSRKGFEDINSLLRGATGPPPPHQRPTPSPPQSAYDSGGRPRASTQDMSTPMKPDGGPSGSSGAPYPGSARKTPRGSATPSYTPMSKGMGTAATPGSKTPSSGRGGGPNSMTKKARRNPCNCKKSKCLKLYCECFAGELYCDGCNCNDCHNTTAYEPERQKAMKDTRAKNPNAFKARITVKPGHGASVGTTTPAAGHNMGCRCKKSECLKKYCECFQAGVMCAGKCKCVDCLNYVGSQALIDKRRKMKDHRGAEMAMRIAEEAWKGGKHSAPRSNVRASGLKPSPVGRGRAPLPPMPHTMMHQPSPSPHHRGPPPPPPPSYMGPMMGHPHPHMGYAPMNMPPVTPGYAHGKQPMMPGVGRGTMNVTKGDSKEDSTKKHAPIGMAPPKTVTPRTPAVRLGFDPHSSKKKRKLGPGAKEPTFPFFGNRPEQPKTTALAIFSYLSNDDLFNSTLVCKQWNKLAMDDELWQF